MIIKENVADYGGGISIKYSDGSSLNDIIIQDNEVYNETIWVGTHLWLTNFFKKWCNVFVQNILRSLQRYFVFFDQVFAKNLNIKPSSGFGLRVFNGTFYYDISVGFPTGGLKDGKIHLKFNTRL